MEAGSAPNDAAMSFQNPTLLGFTILSNNFQQYCLNDGGVIPVSHLNPVAPNHLTAVRTGIKGTQFYRNGALHPRESSAASTIAQNRNAFIGCGNHTGTPLNFTSGRYSTFHAGAAINSQQTSDLAALLSAYRTAVAGT